MNFEKTTCCNLIRKITPNREIEKNLQYTILRLFTYKAKTEDSLLNLLNFTYIQFLHYPYAKKLQ